MIDTATTTSYFAQNLECLDKHFPELAGRIRSSEDRLEIKIDLLNEHDYAVWIKKEEQWRLFHDEQKYYREHIVSEMNTQVEILQQLGTSGYIFYGLDAGLRLAYFFSNTQKEYPIYVIERHIEIIKALLRSFDVRPMISSGRVFFFIGEDAPIQAEQFFKINLNLFMPLAGSSCAAQSDNLFYNKARQHLHSALKDLHRRILSDENRRSVESFYNRMTKNDLIELYSPAKRSHIRVLGELNTETRIMQHVMRDCMDVFKKLGHETFTMEVGGARTCTNLYQADTVRRLMPHLWFKINHVVKENLFFTDNMITVSWILDPLPYLYNPAIAVEDKIARHDQLLIMSKRFMRQELLHMGFPESRLHHFYFGGNIEKYRPLSLSADDRMKYGASVSFVGNYHNIGDVNEVLPPVIQQELLRRMIDEEIYYPYDIQRVVRELEERHGTIKVPEAIRQSLNQRYSMLIPEDYILMMYGWLGLSGAALRVSYLQSIADLPLAIYGLDWDKDPLFSHAQRGPAANGLEVCKIFNASKINIHLGSFTNNHPRVFDVIASGGFLLTRFTPEDEGPGGIGDLFEIGKEIDVFRNKKELREKIEYYLAHDDERQEIARRGYERLVREHTMEHRMKKVFDIVYQGLMNEK